ncbi:hypothetical protein [Arenimonas sp.]|uniref:hypothetical protein n=1 Tax=Arenimonas sp. TaxID=1872635 RepID=UPI0039E2F744
MRYTKGWILCILAALLCACAPEADQVAPAVAKLALRDGVYVGYEGIENLSPEEDPDAFWYYRSELRASGPDVRLEQSPRVLSRGHVTASASDGGFHVFEGRVEQVGARTILRMRKISCDYCAVLVDDPLPSRIEREYVLRFVADGSFELDRVIYSTTPNPKLEPAQP